LGESSSYINKEVTESILAGKSIIMLLLSFFLFFSSFYALGTLVKKHITSSYLSIYNIDFVWGWEKRKGKGGGLETNHLLKQKGIEMNFKHRSIFRSDKLAKLIGQLLFFFFFLDLKLSIILFPKLYLF
jgi:hypothetical protein